MTQSKQIIGLTVEAPYIAIKRQEAKDKLGKKWVLHPESTFKTWMKNKILSK